jgi:hypothetical protein
MMIGRVLRGELPLWLLFALFLVTIVVGPIVVFGLVLFGLISIEPSVLPWLSLFIGPLAVLAVVGPIAALLGVGLFRASTRLGPPGVFVKIGVLGAVLFAPPISWTLGIKLADARRSSALLDQPCLHSGPPANPERDALAAELQKAVEGGTPIAATLRSADEAPRTVSRDEYLREQGDWTGSARLRDCSGIVEGVRAVKQGTVCGSSLDLKVAGFEVLLAATNAPVRELWIVSKPPRYSQGFVFCTEGAIYILERYTANDLSLRKVDAARGQLLGAARIEVPTSGPLPSRDWGDLWRPSVAGSEFSFAIARYEYELTPLQGGTLREIRRFVVPLPF